MPLTVRVALFASPRPQVQSVTLDASGSARYLFAMNDEDLPRPSEPLTLVVKEDLDRLSVDELEARADVLEAEAKRTRAKLSGAKDFRANADALFGGKS